MSKTNPNKPKLAVADPNAALTFAGLEDWFEIFIAGERTDSNGNTLAFTEEHLDSIVANFSPMSAPLVVGHPKTNDPAYGWAAELKRDGNKLFAKAADVLKEFSTAVEKKMYPHRSVSLLPDGNGGFKLRHIGFLGAAAPAVEGMKLIDFKAEEAALNFSYDINDTQRSLAWGLDAIASSMRRVREMFIEKFSLEEADRMIPSYEVDSIQRQAANILSQTSNFNSPINPTGEPNMKTFTQAEMDAAVLAAKQPGEAATAELTRLRQEQRQREFAEAKSKAQAVIEQLVKDGRLLPADAAGVAEFCAHLMGLEGEAAASFEFTAADGKTKASKKPGEFVLEFLGSLKGKVIELGRLPPGDVPVLDFSDSNAVGKAASEYIAEQEKKGIVVSASDAVAHVKKSFQPVK